MKEEEDYKGDTQRVVTLPQSELAVSTANTRGAANATRCRETPFSTARTTFFRLFPSSPLLNPPTLQGCGLSETVQNPGARERGLARTRKLPSRLASV